MYSFHWDNYDNSQLNLLEVGIVLIYIPIISKEGNNLKRIYDPSSSQRNLWTRKQYCQCCKSQYAREVDGRLALRRLRKRKRK